MPQYANLKTLKVTIVNDVAYLSFNRPLQMNTYNFEMSQELPDCVESLAEDKSIKVVVLTGEGNVFMAGGDIDLLKNAITENKEHTAAAIASLHESVTSLQNMDKLVIAAVNGACAGAGISLMLCADLAYVAEGTKFNTAYLNLGLSPDGGLTYFLPRVVGHKKALELILLAEPFWAKDAMELGLVNKVLPKETFMSDVQNIAKQIAAKPFTAVTNIKKLMGQTWQSNLEKQLNDEKTSFIDCTQTSDFQKGIEAFLSKTAAKFG